MAHCRDLQIASVMGTTQTSESKNSFFKRFEHKSGTLVEFWTRFESAMDQQRHTQKQLDNNDKHSSPKTSTHTALESHGVKVYTYSTFNTFKEEAIYSIDTCRIGGFTQRDELEVTTVKNSSRGKNFEVAYSPANGMKTIPDDYVVKRWTKECLRLRMFNCNGEGTDNMEIIDGKQIAMSIMWSEVDKYGKGKIPYALQLLEKTKKHSTKGWKPGVYVIGSKAMGELEKRCKPPGSFCPATDFPSQMLTF
ncbi:protein FAR-RED IMPAIRED RESPONSE 1-like [Silene latifolia]|uniref:protein FAR-RED IMPAIRED RESPONSE 1-like n=1 Tax=Silene latifolia TaxID=37657 RepID=UPI003D77D3EC